MTMSNRELVKQIGKGGSDPHFLIGYLLALVENVADKDTLSQTAAEYARSHLEHLARLAESTAGETRDVPTPGAAG